MKTTALAGDGVDISFDSGEALIECEGLTVDGSLECATLQLGSTGSFSAGVKLDLTGRIRLRNDSGTEPGLTLNISSSDLVFVGCTGTGHFHVYSYANAFISLLLESGTGKLGLSTTSPTALLDVNSNTIRLRTARSPTSATAAGNPGDICWDSDYIYVCVATNAWKKVLIETWS